MKLSYSSDGGLSAFAARLDVLAADAPRLLGEAVAEGVEQALAEEFAGEKGPDGSPWAKRIPPTGSWPILRKSGRMYGSRVVRVIPRGSEFTMDAPAQYHQHGTSRMVARPPFPHGSLPEPWRVAIERAALERLGSALRGAA